MRGLFQGRTWLADAQLPHPPIMEGVLKVIENAVRQAWRQVCETADFTGVNAEEAYEDQLTEALWKRLDYIRLQDPSPIPGFSPELFDFAPREANWRDCQNISIDKQPDLVFKFHGKRLHVPIDSAAYDALFVECKPIDSKHPFIATYLDKGLLRFVDGTYAWAMRDAMMLGYTAEGTSINSKLIPVLSKQPIQKPLKMAGPPMCCQGDTTISDRCETQHNRDFVYPHNHVKAGSVRVRHLWLSYKNTS